MTRAWTILSLAFALSSCSNQSAAVNEGMDGPKYEAITISGSSKTPDFFVRINRRTGEAWVHTQGQSNDRMYLIADSNSLAKGHYKIYGWSEVEPNKVAYFNVYRMDEATGQIWMLVVMAADMYRWKELSSYVARE